MSNDPQQQRRDQILAASAARRVQVAQSGEQPAPVATVTIPEPPPAPAEMTPQQAYANRKEWSVKDGFKIEVVAKGTRPNPGGRPQTMQGGNTRTIDAGARGQNRNQNNVVAVPGRAGAGVKPMAGGRGGVQPVSPVQKVSPVRTQSQTGEVATMLAPQGQPQQRATAAPMPTQSSAPVVDLSVVMSYWSRPTLVEKQQRLMFAQSVRPVGSLVWVNPSDRIRLSGPTLALIAKSPNVQPTVDMGPWMRWGVAAVCNTEFVAIFDDDCMPGPRWIEAAIARLQQSDEHTVVAAGGILYGSDAYDDVRLVGPEAPPAGEVEVDVGRGAWVMRTSTARLVVARARASDVLSTGIHVAAAVQDAGALTIVLPYGRDHALWGMLETPLTEHSMSTRIDEEARAGNAPMSAEEMREQIYGAYRESGWVPWCVMLADASENSVASESG